MHTPSPTACRLLAASAAAYDIGPDGVYAPTGNWYEAAGFTAPPTVVVGGVAHLDAALVGTTPDGIVVAFRGTVPPAKSLEALLDWIQDIFLSEPKACQGFPGRLHTGFHLAWTRLAEGVIAAVKTRYTPGTALHVTGHSKGGSLASIGAWGLRAAGYEPTGVTTFAAAHAGDSVFAKAYDAVFTQIRYENYLDLVPFMPPSADLAEALAKIPLLGRLFVDAEAWDYAPVGRLRYITERGHVIGDEPGLALLRITEIAWAAATDDGSAVGAAHSLDGGYCRGVCPEGMCAAKEDKAKT